MLKFTLFSLAVWIGATVLEFLSIFVGITARDALGLTVQTILVVQFLIACLAIGWVAVRSGAQLQGIKRYAWIVGFALLQLSATALLRFFTFVLTNR